MKIRKMNRKAVSPVIAIVLLLMMTVAAAGAAYFWLTSMQSRMQKASYKSIEKVMEATGRRVIAQATLCKPTYPYEGLVGYWTVDDYNSTGVFDVSGNNNFGTFKGTAFGTDNITGGQVGKALDFDGEDDYVDCGTPPSLNIEYELTLAGWFRQTGDSGGSYRRYLGKDRKYEIMGYTADTTWFKPQIVGKDGNNYGTGWFQGERDTWYFFVFTYDSSLANANGKFYTDGDLSDTFTYDGGIEDSSATAFTITQDSGFNGTIDDVRIYDRALSENEIQELYEAENHSARRRIDVTIRNIGSEEIPKATWVANLKHDGTAVETDAYNASAIDTGELATLKFYFKGFKPNTEYTIELQGTGTSTTVSC